jgi:hypothetical protein
MHKKRMEIPTPKAIYTLKLFGLIPTESKAF